MRSAARVALRSLSAIYLAGLWLDGVGCELPVRVLPRSAEYFMQVAALFPDAATSASQYRAEGWVCADAQWTEIDVRPYFPLDPDDKENRFQRALHFFGEEPAVTKALDAYLVQRHDTRPLGDAIPADRPIGGVRFLSVREPIPAPGSRVHRYERRPLAEYPKAERHVVYRTPKATLDERCGSAGAPADEAPAPVTGPGQ
jgi:hypothetical protein